MKKTNRRWSGVAAVALVALLGTACGSGGEDTAEPDETQPGSETSAPSEADTGDAAAPASVVAQMPFEVGSVDPHSGAVMARLLRGNVTEPLVEIVAQGTELIPGLATSWEATDDTTWVFELESGVTFSNGEVFNAQTVAYNIDRILSEEVVASHASYFEKVTDVVAVDDDTVELITSAPDPLLPRKLVNLPMVPPEASAEVGYPITDPIGTGPYVVESVGADTIVLTANPDYRGEAPQVESVEMVSRPEASARAFALQASEADIAWDVPTDQVGAVPKTESAPLLEMMHFRLNALRGVFTNEKVREAVTIGVDVEEIRQAIFGDEFSQPANSQVAPPGVEGYDESATVPEVDKERAKQLIEEAGVAGETVHIMAPAGRYPKGEEVTEAWALGLEELGLKTEIEFVDYDTWLENLRGADSTDVDALLFGVGAEQGTALQPMSTLLSSDSVISTFPHDVAPEFMELLTAAYEEFDDAERAELIKQANQVVRDHFGNVYLYVLKTVYGMAENVSFEPRYDGRILFGDVTVA